MKRNLLLVLALVLSVSLSLGGTIAYLQDTDEDVNVMTLGNVYIEQLEYERVPAQGNELTNDAWVSTGETDKYGYIPDEVQVFSQAKPLYPAVFADGKIKWDDRNGSEAASGADSYQQSWQKIVSKAGTPAPGSNQLFDSSVKNTIDKFVFVENTGKSDAYVRTWFAFEQGSVAAEDFENVISTNGNTNNWAWETVAADVEIDGNTYVVALATYKGPGSNPNGVLAPGAITYPSLLQVYMMPEATNEDCTAIDGNGNGTYDILVVSQAVQTAGFANAQTALDEAFGEATVANAPFAGMEIPSYTEEGEAVVKEPVEFKGVRYETLAEGVAAAVAAGGGEVIVHGKLTISETVNIPANAAITIVGNHHSLNRAEGFTGTMINVSAGAELKIDDLTVDGGAVWTGAVDETLGRGTTNSGVKATGNLIATQGNGKIVLNNGTVLQNNVGAHAVSLATRGGGSLTLNNSQIINNSSDSGAIWGGGLIVVNEGSKINSNSSTGLAGAIRMVGSCNLTMNGGEISNNVAATDGGAIWGYGASTYNFNGGAMSGNKAGGTGGAMYTGTYSVLNISGDFELCDNAADDSGAIRLTDHTSLTMTGGKVANNTQNGESNAFNTWNNSISITGGEIADDFSYMGGLGLIIGDADIDGVITYNLSTNHNTAYLKKSFSAFRFYTEKIANFNFKPEAGYEYTAGDEAKLICENEGYTVYWDAATGTFRLKAE